MSSRHAQPSAVSSLKGVIAGLLAGVVFALGLIAVSPTLHERLHATLDAHTLRNQVGCHTHATTYPTDIGDDDSACVISLFQHGVIALLALPRLTVPVPAWLATLPVSFAQQLTCGPAYRLQPARGPPALG